MKKAMMILFAVAALSVGARAATITLSDSLDFMSSSSTRNFSIATFDPALGTLNSVSVMISGSTSVTFSYMNFMNSPAVGDITASIAGSIKLHSDGVDLTTTPYSESKVISLNLAPYETSVTEFTPIVATTANQSYYAGSFANFVGAGGTCPLSVIKQSTQRNNSGIGDNSASFITSNSYTATVVYDYTPVPEPATMLLLGLGSLAFMRRRKLVK